VEADARVSPEVLLLAPGGREAAEAGEAEEPISLFRPEPGAYKPGALGEEILVPEAGEETPLSPFLELSSSFFPSSTPAADVPLLPITPELLAEVRGMAPAEVERERTSVEIPAFESLPLAGQALVPPPPRERSSQRPPRGGTRPEESRPHATVGPVMVLVPEAMLETVPEDWADEEAPVVAPGLELPRTEQDGRGRRRRGRNRDRRGPGEEQAVPPVAAAPEAASPVETAPAPQVITVLRAEDEGASRDRDRRERDRPLERERPPDREYKEILINLDERETRIAVLEAGRLVELHVEREERVVGGIYKGRVANVLQGMDAAFVDIGLERNVFLYVGDILFEDTARSGGGDAQNRRTSRDARIKDLVKPGQEILVQVTKGPWGTKGARVSTKISIPGRYLVLMPDHDHLGVSRKIEDARERDRLKRIADVLQPKGFGLIVRTEAEDRSEAELRQDLDYLLNAWHNIQEKNRRVHAPAVIHKDLGIILKTIRDLFGSDVDKLVLDSPEEFEKAVDTMNQLAPDLADRVALYDDPEPLFIRYNLEEEIDRLLKRKVWLRNGAYLLLDTTEALTTIDVNTGKFVGTSSLAETILKTNLDAVDEIARQLRLRDIGGMIVLDFIDMASSRDRQLVMRALENAFKKDRTRIKIAHISPLGLVEMTRKRTAETVTDVMSHVCPYCLGRGRVWSPETVAIQIEREIKRRCATEEIDAMLVFANPEVASYLIGPEGESVEQLERLLRRPVYIRARHDYHIEKWELLPGDMLEMEQEMLPFHGGQVVECLVTKSELITPPRSAAWVDGYFVDLANGIRYQNRSTRVRLTDVRRSFALGEPVAPPTAVDRSEPI
jgi:ribonuclease G